MLKQIRHQDKASFIAIQKTWCSKVAALEFFDACCTVNKTLQVNPYSVWYFDGPGDSW